MTPRDSHAATGAWALRTPPEADTTSADAWRSITMVGSNTETIAPARSPIDAARAWLADPERSALLRRDVLEHAERSLDLAERHYRDLDLLAGELANDANRTGVVDETRIATVDRMVNELAAFSTELRTTLGIAHSDPDAAADRLASGLAAGARGGIVAFVAAL